MAMPFASWHYPMSTPSGELILPLAQKRRAAGVREEGRQGQGGCQGHQPLPQAWAGDNLLSYH
jgi:hypothetical protein